MGMGTGTGMGRGMGMGTGLAPLQPSDLETLLVILGPQILRLLLLQNEGVPHCAIPSLVS